MRLLRVQLENFRAFGKVDFDFRDASGVANRCVLLVGPNGAGKSSVLDAIAKFFGHFGFYDAGGIARVDLDVRRGTHEARIAISWEDPEVFAATSHFVPEPAGISVSVTEDTMPRAWPRRLEDGVIVRLDVFRFLPAQDPAGPNARDHSRGHRTGALTPTTPGGARFFAIKQWLVNQDFYRVKAKADRNEDWKPWDALVHAMNTIVEPYRFAGIDDDFRVLFETPSGEKFPIESMSDGLRTFFIIVGELFHRLDLATKNRGSMLDHEAVCLIDEIDAHLHPKWQRRALPALMKLFPKVQFIATTHSPFVVESVPEALIFKLVEEEL